MRAWSSWSAQLRCWESSRWRARSLKITSSRCSSWHTWPCGSDALRSYRHEPSGHTRNSYNQKYQNAEILSFLWQTKNIYRSDQILLSELMSQNLDLNPNLWQYIFYILSVMIRTDSKDYITILHVCTCACWDGEFLIKKMTFWFSLNTSLIFYEVKCFISINHYGGKLSNLFKTQFKVAKP